MTSNKLNEDFPETLFVCHDSCNTKAFEPLAHTREIDAIEDDGPTVIAVYKLVEKRERRKRIVEVP